MREIAPLLLRWYDVHAREMPWRVGPAERASGARPDPYGVWLSEVMSQQTTLAAVRPYWMRFTARWPDVAALAAAEEAAVMAEWAGLGYYARARNLHACARTVAADHGGRFPQTPDGLRALPGIGPYTAAAIAAICFDVPATVVDGNVERVMARLHAVRDPLPGAKRRLGTLAEGHTPTERPGDYAQAIMDLGATICTPRSPACAICPLIEPCAARAAGVAAELPAKAPKAPKPDRRAILWAARHPDGRWLLETRPPKGLLGGMLGWPTTTWAEAPEGAPPVVADWIDAGAVTHVFTHFRLEAEVRVAEASGAPERGTWQALDPGALPTVMRKAHDLAHATLRSAGMPGRTV